MNKCAVILGNHPTNSQQTITSMANAQKKAQFTEHNIFQLEDCGNIASISRTGITNKISLQLQGSKGNLLVITGLPLTKTGEINQQLATIVESDYQNAAQALTKFDGAFAALYWDANARKLAIVTDILGMQPLYMARCQGVLLLASEIQALAASGLIDLEMDSAAWGAFVTFGHFIGNRSSLKQVERVAPGSIIIYDPDNDTISENPYWQWPSPQPEMRLEDLDTEALVDIIEQDIKAYLTYHQPGTILLSGGLDSRLILAILSKIGIQPNGVVLDHEDEFFGADGIYARLVAKKLGVPLQNISSDPNFFSSPQYLDYLQFNEVGTPSLFLFISQVLQHLQPEMQCVWDGLFPNVLFQHFPSISGGFTQLFATKAMSPNSLPWQGVKKIFSPRLAAEIYEEFMTLLQVEKAKYSDDDFGIHQFMVRNRTIHRISINPLKVYSNIVSPFTPGLNQELWRIAPTIPPNLKANFRLYLEIYRRHFPHMLSIPFVSGGKLLRPQAFSPLHEFFTIASKVQSGIAKSKLGRDFLQQLGVPLHRKFFKPSTLLAEVIAQVNPAHPDLNSDNICRIKVENETDPTRFSSERELLFYWQVWRWIMEGKIYKGRVD
ncbi:hypothetical protein [Limnofasciculus baicalensis]|uniref:asparagine synthase (glutamine-hydrolyzing) n=1 Tax=Limnofasciculus baicalensis BBK-W-15 TaxID=2699891 RepID=A0AAE3GV58_9CYAN|nr:hypothetical protein [Limnofasciculus baicalensis]MCP2731285.1 hypothetical protein [Limnofasciculus baicalensis BBK-W-15]